jgi:hypothetical protein
VRQGNRSPRAAIGLPGGQRAPGRAGGVCGIRFDHQTGIFEAAADFRRAGYALGW